MRLTSLQEKKVKEILSYYNNYDKTFVEFVAPTGSGKTLMATNVISKLIEYNPTEDFLFIIATLSSGDLPKAFEQKILQYKRGLDYSKFEVEHIESPSNSDKNIEGTIKLLPEKNKVYIFGKSTFGKGRIFTEQNVINDFIHTAVTQNYKIIYIRDEAHVGIDNTNRKEKGVADFEKMMDDNAHFIIHMTATPNYKTNTNKVILSRSDLINPNLNDNKWLIKSQPISLLDTNLKDTDLLKNAIERFKVIQDEYKKLEKDNVFIRPAMLIQVDNEPSNEIEKNIFLKEINKIKNILDNYNLSWAKYFGNDDKETNRVYGSNFSLFDLTHNMSDIDVIIFKIGPSIGWDIPRACMLLQLRNVTSIKLNTQTIGRIMRNPYPNLAKNEITDKYYLYSNNSISENFKIYNYKVKDNFKHEDFAVIKIKNKNELNIKYDDLDINEEFYKFLFERKNEIIQEIKNLFVLSGDKEVYKEIKHSINGNIIYKEISNVFIVLKKLEQLKLDYQYLYNNVKRSMFKFYKTELINETLFNSKNIKLDHLEMVILLRYINEIKQILKSKINFTPKYEIRLETYNPKQYIQIIDSELDKEAYLYGINNYLFDINKNNKESKEQPLDSKAEIIAFEYIKNNIQKNDIKVSLWSKNMVFSNVGAEYLDTYNNIRTSYFDYIVKFSNGIFLYIEVKSKNDIDIEKTNQLLRAYESYFKNNQTTLFNTPIVLSLWHIDEKNGPITTSYYDERFFNDDLNKLSIEELFKKLSTIK